MGGKKLSIEELAEELTVWYWQHGVDTLLITEEFKKGRCTYSVHDLEVEIEDKVVFCNDSNNVLYINKCVLMAFVKDSLVSIHQSVINGNLHEELEFKTGIVMIDIT